jgi:molybdopterin-synthase adenylyltransferase
VTSRRYARQVALPDVGEQGQARLSGASMLLVGLGGLGCPAAQYLATSGVGRLVLNDFDRVDETNLPRQILFTADDVGELKVAAASARLRALNPEIEIAALPERLDTAALAATVRAVDIVLDGTDNFAARFAVNRACVVERKPLVSGAAVRLEGQVAVFLNRPGDPCYSCLYDDEDEWLGDCQGNGVLAPVPGVIGTVMAQEALKLALGWPSALHNTLLLWDAKRGDWQRVGLKRDPDCEICGAA